MLYKGTILEHSDSSHQPEKQTLITQSSHVSFCKGIQLREVKCSPHFQREEGCMEIVFSYCRNLNVKKQGQDFLLIPVVFLDSVECPFGIGYY